MSDLPSTEQAHCIWHGSPLPPACPTCMVEFPGPIPDTAEQRAAELERILPAPLPVPFEMMHERIERLVGRPVYTHEMAYPEYLAHEIRTGQVPSLEGIIAKFPHDKPVIVVEASDD